MNVKNITLAAHLIKDGGLLGYPTDTVYGIGCDPHNIKALKKLMLIKQERKKPFPLLVSSYHVVKRIAQFNIISEALANRFWPGALTLILPKKISFPTRVTLGKDTVAVRIPRHHRTIRLIELCGGILIGTSANKTGQQPCLNAVQVKNTLRDKVDMILDDQENHLNIASTMVKVNDDSVQIIRWGAISESDIIDHIRKLKQNRKEIN